MTSTPLSGTTHLRKFIQESHSPSSPRKRVTRSQSRERELSKDNGGDGDRRRWGQRKGRARQKQLELDAVEEEPSITSPQKTRAQQYNREVPESPEDVGNMSGTTFLPASEPDTDVNADMMIESLPDLERAAKNVLDFLVLSSPDMVTIVNVAKKLGDPKTKHPQRRMLERSMSNLMSNSKYFTNQTYIDVRQVNRLVLPMLTEKSAVEENWSIDPILHRANCARFAHQVLLASGDASSPRQAIINLEGRFPSPFMCDIVGNKRNGDPAKSSLETETLNLALEIRTQFLIHELERRKDDDQFDGKAIMNGVFFDDIMPEEEEEGSGDGQTYLRGFNLGLFEDENGRLPECFRDTVYSRISEIRMLTGDLEDSVNIDVLKGAYRWEMFAMRAAQWVRKRDEEINQVLKSQRGAEDVRDDYIRRAASVVEDVDLSQDVTAVHDEEVFVSAPESTAQTEQPPPASAPENRERRKSGKKFRNLQAIGRLGARMNSATVSPAPRRHSEFAVPAPPQASKPSAPAPRRETLPALPEPTPPTPEQSRRRSPSPDNYDTSLREEEELTFDDSMATAPEKSTSPTMRGVMEEALRQAGPTQASQAAEETTAPSSSALKVFESIKSGRNPSTPRRPRTKGPAHFIDRQVDAHRVSPIGHEAERASVEKHRQTQQSRKRTRVASDDEDASDDDFAQDERSVDVAAKRAQKPEQPQQKRQRIVEDSSRLLGTLAAGLARASEAESPGRRPTAGHETRPEPSPPRPTQRRKPSLHVPATPRTYTGGRRGWTEGENARLIRLIEKHANKWAQIENSNIAENVPEGEERIDRNQGQLKDRARNMLLEFIRRGERLPKNFELVTIKSNDFKTLQEQGYDIPAAISAKMNKSHR
ncbi:hypothetical protein MW887_002760 [Aspergillus wentii]|nr:hypothetical protein MW887_002760 [Aspergillus wentii]